MRIILGVLAPDAGEVRWRGQPMNDEIHKQIGYLPEDHGQTFHDGSLLIASSRLIAVTGWRDVPVPVERLPSRGWMRWYCPWLSWSLPPQQGSVVLSWCPVHP
jgi:hypothetical protein